VRSALVNVPVFSPQVAAGQHDVGELRGLGQEERPDDDEQPLLGEDRADPGSSGSDTAGLVPLIQRNRIEPCSA
jgi:hypothetical protein